MFNMTYTHNITNSEKLVIDTKWVNDCYRDLITVIADTQK